MEAVDARPMRPCNSPPDGVEQPGVRKKSLYTGDISDTNLLLNQVRQSILHVLDEWAKVIPVPSGAHLAAQAGSARSIEFASFPPMQKTSGFSIGLFTGSAWRISAGFVGPAEGRFSAYCRFLADRSNERPMGRLTIHAKLSDWQAISSIIALPHAGVASVRVGTELVGSLWMGVGEAMLFTSFRFA